MPSRKARKLQKKKLKNKSVYQILTSIIFTERKVMKHLECVYSVENVILR